MRWADFGPMPGRRPSSSIRSWTGAAYIGSDVQDRTWERLEYAFLGGEGRDRGGVDDVGYIVEVVGLVAARGGPAGWRGGYCPALKDQPQRDAAPEMSGENALGLVQEVVGPRQQPSIREGKDRRTVLD